MFSSFDFVKLNAMLKDFNNLTHMRITVYDDSYREITAYPEKIAPICRFIRTNARAEAACHACDMEACRQALKLRSPYIYRCHAGLTEAVTPVFMGNIVMAYVSFGHLFSYAQREEGRREILQSCEQYGLDGDTLDRYVADLPDTDETYILSAAHVLEAVASFLCMDRMIMLKQHGLQVQIDEYIAQHFTEDISIDSLCRHFGIGRTALYEFSKQNYGVGIARHIRNLRIEYAKQLLTANPELNISEVAEACGFVDYNYFIAVFSRVAGTSPRKYRMQQAGEEK